MAASIRLEFSPSPTLSASGPIATTDAPVREPDAEGEPPAPDGPSVKEVDNEYIKQGMPDTEFNLKYPPDPWGEEAAPNARVWKVYRDEVIPADQTMLETWNKTLDVLLIFAGLFSAVSTAFLIESYKNLQPDYSQYVATFLYTAAVAHATSGAFIPPLATIVAPDSFVETSTTQRWVNGLWFTSLSISLSVALFSIMVKQWLDQYHTRVFRPATSPELWARRHVFYQKGLESWGVPLFISLLPLLLHVSLFLFFAGLVLFLLPLDSHIANTLLGVLAIVLIFYLLSVALPVWHAECPSYTPLLAWWLRPWSAARLFCLSAVASLRYVRPIRRSGLGPRARVMYRLRKWTHSLVRYARRCLSQNDQHRERDAEHSGSALALLAQRTVDTAALASCIEAFGGMASVPAVEALVLQMPEAVVVAHLRMVFGKPFDLPVSGFTVGQHARCLRASAMLRNSIWVPFSKDYTINLGRHFGADHFLYTALALERGDPVSELKHHPLICDPGLSWAPIARPRRALVITILRFVRQSPGHPLHNVQHILLVLFCIGFAVSEPEGEEVLLYALRTLTDAVLLEEDRRSLLGRNEWVLGFNSLCILTSRNDAYGLDSGMVIILSRHIRALINVGHASGDIDTQVLSGHLALQLKCAKWAELQGFSAFIRSDVLASLEDRRVLHACALRLCEWPRRQWFDDADFWECIAALCKASLNWARASAPLFSFLFTHGVASARRGRSQLAPAFLDGPSAVHTWAWPDGDESPSQRHLHGTIASTLALDLCFAPADEPETQRLVALFFSGRFVLDRFRAWLAAAQPGVWEMDERRLAEHCVRLLPPAWLRICDELHRTAAEDAAAQAHVAGLRSLFMRDGEAYGLTCYPGCKCMIHPRRLRWARTFIRRASGIAYSGFERLSASWRTRASSQSRIQDPAFWEERELPDQGRHGQPGGPGMATSTEIVISSSAV